MKNMKQITLTAFEDKVEELKALLQFMVNASRQEEGCIKYELYQQAEVPKTFMLIEIWSSDDTLSAHKNSAHFKAFKVKAPELIESKSGTVWIDFN